MSTSSPLPNLTTSVPQIVFTPQGPIIPADQDILAGAQIDINTAFGGGLNPQLSTPQGQLASSLAAIVADKDSEIAFICTQVDPQYATGRFQDAIAQIYFLDRKPATATVVICDLIGLVNTVISAGTLALDTSRNTYALTASVTIPNSGSVSSTWKNILTGPTPCPEGTLNQVYQSVPGWDAITNPSDGTIGQLVETASEFEIRRQNSVALNGRGTCPSIYAAVFSVANVLDVYVIDNPTSSTVLTGSSNYPVGPNSVYVAVLGGLASDIATAIWTKKDIGCSYNGNTSFTVVDDSGYSFPQPTYNVKYEIPSALPILFAVQIVNAPSLPANIVQLIQAAIIAQFQGTNGATMARIGSLILATSYYGVIAASAANVLLISVLIGTSSPTSTSVQVGIDQTPTITAANISVTLV